MKMPTLARNTAAQADSQAPATTAPTGGDAGADDRDQGAREERRRKLEGTGAGLLVPVSWLVAVAVLAMVPPTVLITRLGLVLWAVTLLVVPVAHCGVQVTRWWMRSSRKPQDRKRAKAPLPGLFTRSKQWGDSILFRDTPTWRRTQWAMSLVCLVVVAVMPTPLKPVWQPAVALGIVGVWWLIVGVRQASLARMRAGVASMIWSIAQVTLKYPRSQGMIAMSQWLDLITPTRAVRITQWDVNDVGLPVAPRQFHVMAPPALSVTDDEAWSEFEKNLNVKLPRNSGWHVERDSNGAGAVVAPAYYPTSVIWDGEYDDKELMGYVLGSSLDEQGQPQRLDLVNPANHCLFTGGTGSGKTSVVEIVMAQTLLKPMPWDPSLHGQVHVIDPKGPLAGRWQGRPGVLVSRGDKDGENEYGDEISGFQVMAAHCDLIEEEHRRRAAVLAQYPNAGNWHDLPPEVKKAERLCPVIVVIDEYLDFSDTDKARGAEAEKIEAENDARAHVSRLATYWARKSRNVGIHLIVVLQEAKMENIGSQLKRQAMVRAIMGQMDDMSYKGMFDTSAVPTLPTTRKKQMPDGTVKSVPIPGRGLIQTATKGPIHRFQAFWFGGPQNADSLDKWLPRDPNPGTGVFDGDAAKIVMASMPDLNGDGIPDAWQAGEGAPEGVFPAAEDGVAPRRAQCAWEGCDNPSAYTCPRDGRGYCMDHTGPSPDPAETGRFGQAYINSHPLTIAGAADLYKQVTDAATGAGLAAAWAPVASSDGQLTGQVQLLVTTPEGKMVAQVVAGPEMVQARTAIERSGVYGLDASLTAVKAAIQARGAAA